MQGSCLEFEKPPDSLRRVDDEQAVRFSIADGEADAAGRDAEGQWCRPPGLAGHLENIQVC